MPRNLPSVEFYKMKILMERKNKFSRIKKYLLIKMIRLVFVLLLLITIRSQAQQMTYIKNGTVSLNDKLIKNPHQLKKILQQQNSQASLHLYKKYIWRKRSAQFFSSIAGIGLVMTVEDEFSPRPKINWSYAGICIGASITAELFHRPANRVLKEIVGLYNEELYFQPIRKKNEMFREKRRH